MRRTSSLFGLGILAAVLSAATADVAYAHVNWFERAMEFPLRWDLFFRPLPLAFVAAVVLATLARRGFCGRGAGAASSPAPRRSARGAGGGA